MCRVGIIVVFILFGYTAFNHRQTSTRLYQHGKLLAFFNSLLAWPTDGKTSLIEDIGSESRFAIEMHGNLANDKPPTPL